MFKCDMCGECCKNLNKSSLYETLHNGDGVCYYLKGHYCSIYNDRPLLCRVDQCYGTIFKDILSYEYYLELNYKYCNELKKKQEEITMALPLILGVAALAAGITGVVKGVNGAKSMNKANTTMSEAKEQYEKNIKHFEEEKKLTSSDMDKLGKLELEILYSFKSFSATFEKIKNKPIFEDYTREGVTLPKYDKEELTDASIGAGVLLGALGGASLGTAGGFAAAGATTAAVVALGTASTGTTIASLSGVALTNATLAALGGGSIAAGGGGMALGSVILGGATLGVGLLVGGLIFDFTGDKLSDKADEAWKEMKIAESTINKICVYLVELRNVSNKYYDTLSLVNKYYQEHLKGLESIVNLFGHNDWNTFTDEEKKVTENTVLLVGLIYNMCKVQLVLKSAEEDELNTINTDEAEKIVENANAIIKDNF